MRQNNMFATQEASQSDKEQHSREMDYAATTGKLSSYSQS